MPRAGWCLFAVVLLLLVPTVPFVGPLGAPAAVGSSSTSGRGGVGHEVGAPRPGNGSAASVERTYFLRNESDAAGNVVPGDGGLPYCVAYDAATDRLYVGNWATNYLTVLNATSRAIVGYLPVGVNGTEGLLVANDSLYVVGWDLVLVQVYNLTTDTIVANIRVGSGPWALAFNPAQGLVYVTMDSSNSLVAISNRNYSVVGDQPVRSSPQAVGYDPTSHEVFVGDDGDTVTVLNGTTLAYVTNLTVGASPWSIAYDAWNQQLYVANQDGRSFSVVDGTNNSVLGTYGLGTLPNATTLDPTGHWVYFANGEANNVTAVNTSDLADRRSYAIGAGPTGLAFDAALGELVTTNFETDNLTFLDAASGGLAATVVNGVTPTGLAYDTSTMTLYVADASQNEVLPLNLSDGLWGSSIPVAPGPTGLSLDTGNATLWVLSPRSATVSRVDLATGQVADRFPVGFGADTMSADPAAGRFFVSFPAAGVVEEFDTSNGSLAASIPLTIPTTVSYCAATGLVYAVDGFGGNELTEIDPLDGAVVARAGVGILASTIVCDPYGSAVYAVNHGTGNVTVVNAHTLAPAGSLSIRLAGQGADYDPVDAELAVSIVANLPTSGTASLADPLELLGTVNRSAAGNVTVGAGAGSVLYLPGLDRFVVANALSGTLSLVATGTPPPTLVSVTVSPTQLALVAGTSDAFNVTARSDYGVPLLTGVTYLWNATPPGVGTITPTDTGRVLFLAGPTAANGTVGVLASYAGRELTATARVEVLPAPIPPLAGVTMSPTAANLTLGTTFDFRAVAFLAGGGPPSAPVTYVWAVAPATLGTFNTTGGPLVAFTGRSVGTGTLSVTAYGSGPAVVAEATVDVALDAAQSLQAVTVVPRGPLAVIWGESVELTAIATAADGTNLSNVTQFTWHLAAPAGGSLHPAGAWATYLAPSTNLSDLVVVTASYLGRSANASVSIAVSLGALPPRENGTGSSVPWWETPVGPVPVWALAAALAVAIAGIVAAARRRGRRGPRDADAAKYGPGAAPAEALGEEGPEGEAGSSGPSVEPTAPEEAAGPPSGGVGR